MSQNSFETKTAINVPILEFMYHHDKKYVKEIIESPSRDQKSREIRDIFLRMIKEDTTLTHDNYVSPNSEIEMVQQILNPFIMRTIFDIRPTQEGEVSIKSIYGKLELSEILCLNKDIFTSFMDYFIRLCICRYLNITFIDHDSERVLNRDDNIVIQNYNHPLNNFESKIKYSRIIDTNYKSLKENRFSLVSDDITKILITSFNYHRARDNLDLINSFSHFREFHIDMNIISSIQSYIQYKINSFENINILKLNYNFNIRNFLTGFCDIIINDELISYRNCLKEWNEMGTSRNYGMKYEHWLSSVIYASILRVYSNIEINVITIFDPLEGHEMSIDISQWRNESEIMKTIYDCITDSKIYKDRKLKFHDVYEKFENNDKKRKRNDESSETSSKMSYDDHSEDDEYDDIKFLLERQYDPYFDIISNYSDIPIFENSYNCLY